MRRDIHITRNCDEDSRARGLSCMYEQGEGLRSQPCGLISILFDFSFLKKPLPRLVDYPPRDRYQFEFVYNSLFKLFIYPTQGCV